MGRMLRLAGLAVEAVPRAEGYLTLAGERRIARGRRP